MSPQFIMKCGLKDFQKSLDPETTYTPYWKTYEAQMRSAVSEIENLRYYRHFYNHSEDSNNGVITADWNYVSKRTYSLLERAGYDCEWADQIEECENCNLAVHSTAQCYGDMQVAKHYECGRDGLVTLCPRCAVERFEEDALPSLINNPNNADTLGMDLESFGFARHNGEYESGHHVGQTDNPKQIMDSIHESNPDLEVVFQIRDIGQFDIKFSAWTRKKEEE